MPLSDTECRNAKPGAKSVKLFDGGGLYLEVSPAGGKLWRLKYRFAGKEKRLALGAYPEVPLAGRKDADNGKRIRGARDLRDDAKRLLAEGLDPGQQKRQEKLRRVAAAADSFDALAREWLQRQTVWTADYRDLTLRRFERDVFPWIGPRPISDIKPFELLAVLKRIEERGAVETAHRAFQMVGKVFRYAVGAGRAERDITTDIRGQLRPWKKEHHAAITNTDGVGELLRAIDGYAGSVIVVAALRLAALLFVRPGELRRAEWVEIDLDAAEWRIPAAKMKMRRAHLVPLSTQSVAALRELQPLTGHRRYVFPGERSPLRPMSENTVNAALRRLGFDGDQMTGHGFRAMARTLLAENGWNPEVIERQLAHKAAGAMGEAYDRTQFLPERRRMMQAWADYLDVLRQRRKVIAGDFGRTAA